MGRVRPSAAMGPGVDVTDRLTGRQVAMTIPYLAERRHVAVRLRHRPRLSARPSPRPRLGCRWTRHTFQTCVTVADGSKVACVAQTVADRFVYLIVNLDTDGRFGVAAASALNGSMGSFPARVSVDVLPPSVSSLSYVAPALQGVATCLFWRKGERWKVTVKRGGRGSGGVAARGLKWLFKFLRCADRPH